MEPLESKIEQDAVDLIWKYLGVKGSKLSIKGEAGYPDRIFWVPGGKPILIEFKRPGEMPRINQNYIIDNLLKLGYKVEVHDNAVKAFQAVINSVDTKALHEEGHKILIRARRRCAVLRSRLGKNGDNTCSNKNLKKEKVS